MVTRVGRSSLCNRGLERDSWSDLKKPTHGTGGWRPRPTTNPRGRQTTSETATRGGGADRCAYCASVLRGPPLVVVQNLGAAAPIVVKCEKWNNNNKGWRNFDASLNMRQMKWQSPGFYLKYVARLRTHFPPSRRDRRPVSGHERAIDSTEVQVGARARGRGRRRGRKTAGQVLQVRWNLHLRPQSVLNKSSDQDSKRWRFSYMGINSSWMANRGFFWAKTRNIY